MTKPFLKWAGSKYRIIEQIKHRLPKGKRFIEPFVGSGAVFLNTDYDDYLLADVNADLINLYQILQTEGQPFIEVCQTFFTPDDNHKEVYYRNRSRFNSATDIRERSALFLYLNKHCYNGLCRYNSKGFFNVPFGRYTKPYFPEKEMFYFHQQTQRATFQKAHFSSTMDEARPGDVVYCDPPYVPLSETANFTAYSSDGFGNDAQRELAEKARVLADQGVTVLISNHDVALTRQLYTRATLHSFDVQRYISRNAANRGKAKELVAIFKGNS